MCFFSPLSGQTVHSVYLLCNSEMRYLQYLPWYIDAAVAMYVKPGKSVDNLILVPSTDSSSYD